MQTIKTSELVTATGGAGGPPGLLHNADTWGNRAGQTLASPKFDGTRFIDNANRYAAVGGVAGGVAAGGPGAIAGSAVGWVGGAIGGLNQQMKEILPKTPTTTPRLQP